MKKRASVLYFGKRFERRSEAGTRYAGAE
jgi:hypothetical protein